jgi:phenylpropionate dioxygenase-like ring-hydroxylating dioxygenase large terminal subunit
LILSSDFTDDLKIEMSNFSIEKQIEIIRDINDQKHRKIESQEQRIREQESQITLMQSVIYSMQNQVQEQSKLIASLQQQQQVDLLRLEREVQEQRNKDQMTSMQNQLREQCKLIASLQSHLVVNKKEESKVEVDMFADWLND